jgi:DNA-binding GntR family transcriptional regulator
MELLIVYNSGHDVVCLAVFGAVFSGPRSISGVTNPVSRLHGSGRLSNQLYDELRDRIITGHYPQGQRLIEEQIADEFRVSRIPLREAMPLLAKDGFVVTLPRRGAQVTTWDTVLVDELFDARLAVEVRAGILAARRAKTDLSFREDLDVKVAETLQALHGDDPRELAMAHAGLHQSMVEMSGNRLLASLMEQIAGRLTWMYFLTSSNDQSQPGTEHEAILDAIYSGNEGLTEALVYAHIDAGRAPSKAALQLETG